MSIIKTFQKDTILPVSLGIGSKLGKALKKTIESVIVIRPHQPPSFLRIVIALDNF